MQSVPRADDLVGVVFDRDLGVMVHILNRQIKQLVGCSVGEITSAAWIEDTRIQQDTKTDHVPILKHFDSPLVAFQAILMGNGPVRFLIARDANDAVQHFLLIDCERVN